MNVEGQDVCFKDDHSALQDLRRLLRRDSGPSAGQAERLVQLYNATEYLVEDAGQRTLVRSAIDAVLDRTGAEDDRAAGGQSEGEPLVNPEEWIDREETEKRAVREPLLVEAPPEAPRQDRWSLRCDASRSSTGVRGVWAVLLPLIVLGGYRARSDRIKRT